MKNFIFYYETLDRRTRKTKYSIHVALLELLKEKQLNEITVSELAQLADINRKTFYNHYTTIEDVLKELEENLVDNLFSSFNKNDFISDITNPKPFFQNITEETQKRKDLCKLLIDSGEYKYLTKKIGSYLLDYISEGIQQNFEFNSSILPYILGYLINGLTSVFEEWILAADPISKEELVTLLCNLVRGTLSGFEPKQEHSVQTLC